jgi:hypothetical protein
MHTNEQAHRYVASERETILAGRQIAAWRIVNLRFRELPPQRAKRFRRSLDDRTAQNGVGRPPQLAPSSTPSGSDFALRGSGAPRSVLLSVVLHSLSTGPPQQIGDEE